MNFKFLVGQTVYHRLWKRNACIARRLHVQDVLTSYNAYDLAFINMGDESFKHLDETPEGWLEEERPIID